MFELRQADDSLITNDYEAASLFVIFFAKCFADSFIASLPLFSADVMDSISDFKITEDLVYDKVSCLKCTFSPGPDGIAPSILKSCSSTLCSSLSLLMQQSFRVSSLSLD